jgi:putative membrane protein insertion efficiency factor
VNLAQKSLVAAVRVYRVGISPVLTSVFGPMGFGCRFTPTCSDYAAQAIAHHGACRGTILAVRRLCRCHPWGGCGYDPVPAPKPGVASSEFGVPRDVQWASTPQPLQSSGASLVRQS